MRMLPSDIQWVEYASYLHVSFIRFIDVYMVDVGGIYFATSLSIESLIDFIEDNWPFVLPIIKWDVYQYMFLIDVTYGLFHQVECRFHLREVSKSKMLHLKLACITI